MPLDVSNLSRVIASLETALVIYENSEEAPTSPVREMLQDAVIQRFEFTFEVAWKALKRHLGEYSLERVDAMTSCEPFQPGYEQGMLRDAEAWMVYLQRRNLTSHVSNTDIAATVFDSAAPLLHNAKFLFAQIRERTT